MTRDEIIEIAQQVTKEFDYLWCNNMPELERFADLVEQRANAWRPASEPPDSERLVIAWCQGRAHVALHMPDTDPHWYQCPSPNNEDWYDLNDVTHWHDVTPPTEGK